MFNIVIAMKTYIHTKSGKCCSHLQTVYMSRLKTKTKKQKQNKIQTNLAHQSIKKIDLSQFCQVDGLNAVEKLTTTWILSILIRVGDM